MKQGHWASWKQTLWGVRMGEGAQAPLPCDLNSGLTPS